MGQAQSDSTTSSYSSPEAFLALMSGEKVMPGVKVKQQRVFRPKTPSMNAIFLQHLSAMDLGDRHM